MEHLTLYNDIIESTTKEEIEEFKTEIIKDFNLSEKQLLELLTNLNLEILNLNFPHIIMKLDYYKFDNLDALKEKWLFNMYDKDICEFPQIDQINNPILYDYLKSECCLNSDFACKINSPKEQICDIIKLSHYYCLKYILLKINDINILNELLFESCENNNYNIVKILAERHIHMDIKNNFGETPFYWACRKGHAEIAKLLLKSHVEINIRDTIGYTPLHLACSRGYKEIVKLLLENGAEINVKSKYGKTPIHFACYYGYVEIVKLLLEKGVVINVKNKFGKTPAYLACYYGHTEIVKLLLEKR